MGRVVLEARNAMKMKKTLLLVALSGAMALGVAPSKAATALAQEVGGGAEVRLRGDIRELGF